MHLVVAALAVTTSAWMPPALYADPIAAEGQAALNPDAQIKPWGFGLDGMNQRVRAGDNFFDYANGEWLRRTTIPPDKAIYDQFAVLEDLSAQRTRAILEEAAKRPGSRIGDFYASFLDRRAADARGLAPIMPVLKQIDDAETPDAIAAAMGRLTRIGVSQPLDGSVDADDRDPDVAVYQLSQGGLGLSEREDYLSSDPHLVANRAAYGRYLAQLLRLAGEASPEARAAAVLAFETQIATAQKPLVDIQDVDANYNPTTTEEIGKAAPHFAWASLFHVLGAPNGRLIARQPEALTKSAEIVATADPRVVKDYLKLRTLDTFAPYLSQPFIDANFDFRGKVQQDLAENQPLWKRATDTISYAMGEEVGRIYVERYFPPEAKAKADALVRNILAQWDHHLQNLEWMSPETRKRARAKLAALVPEMGYPRKWRDYSTLVIRRDDLAGNVMRSNAFEYDRILSKLGRPIDKTEWYTQLPPMAVNGYANHKTSQVVFSAAILQAPFFDPNADPAVNYGAFGSVIAHEIGHQFDQQGARYDERGRLSDWWSAQDVKGFNALTGKLIEQYDRYEAVPGKFVNGKLTLAENIADLAGVTVAYDAYRASRMGEPPMIDGLTGDQRFFLGWAQIWRASQRTPMRLQRLMTDIHSPVEQRVSVVRNVDGWYRAFGVKPGDKLYLKPRDRVRIW